MTQTAEKTERIMSTTRIAALTLSASALIFAACTSAAMAQRGANACVAEMMAQCPGVQPGEGRIRACFRDHFKDFSKSCQAFILKGALVNGPPRFPPPEQAGLGIGGRPFPPPESIGGRPFPPRSPGTASSAGAEGKRHLKKRGG